MKCFVPYGCEAKAASPFPPLAKAGQGCEAGATKSKILSLALLP